MVKQTKITKLIAGKGKRIPFCHPNQHSVLTNRAVSDLPHRQQARTVSRLQMCRLRIVLRSYLQKIGQASVSKEQGELRITMLRFGLIIQLTN